MSIETVLLDARSSAELLDEARAEIASARWLGLDCETQDEDRHAGLNLFNNSQRHVFDHRRTTMTGFSFYAAGSDRAWYLNLAHADIENRLPRETALEFLAAIPDKCIVLAHNAPFELVMFKQCLGVELQNVLCTLQMAVSHHGPDEYKPEDFARASLHALAKHGRDILEAYADYDPESGGRKLNSRQAELLSLFIGKQSKAAHSYNGFVNEIAIGYNLKKLVKSLFGYQMTTYKEVLDGRAHMGELTGDEVAAYGADDAYWAVRVFEHLKDDMSPELLRTFVEQENPMVQVYADAWRGGLRLDMNEVYAKRDEERANYAAELRTFKALVKEFLPFPEEPSAPLLKYQKWYESKDNWKKIRKRVETYLLTPDSSDDFRICTQCSNPVGNAWREDKPVNLLNPVYYQGMRVILHDLMGMPLVWSDGEVSTDKEARGRLLDKADERQAAVMRSYQNLADIEQRVKLFITPYTQLIDPETERVYPSISSMLATRRMAMSFPNAQQLAKESKSAYIRGFYLPDDDESVIVSADWSAIELVLIGEMSGDPAFKEVYGQLPYGDLHSGAAADCLAVKTLPGLTEEEYKGFKFGRNPNNRKLHHIITGAPQTPKDFFKFTRGTPVGKGANFSYWYSGALSTVGQNLGWTSDEMWQAVDRYRERFEVAERWRVRQQEKAILCGEVELPDHHKRVRLEATDEWRQAMENKFAQLSAAPAIMNYALLALNRLQSRAKNQVVNALIQGTCATLAKRTIVRMVRHIEDRGWEGLARFMVPIHDEVLFSVHRSILIPFIALLRQEMVNHRDIVQTLPLDSTVSVGRSFKPFDGTPYSQFELDEMLLTPGLVIEEQVGERMPEDRYPELIDWMFLDLSKPRLAVAA